MVCVALLFTVGCQSNGGPWYSPTTYSFGNPFSKTGSSPHSTGIKPSLDSQPNISTPQGGYTDGSSLTHRLGGSSENTSSTPPSYWGDQSPMISQGSSNNYQGGYSDPRPSQYPPAYIDNQYQSPPQQNQTPYQSAPGGYPSTPETTIYQTGGYQVPQADIYRPEGGFPNSAPVDNFGAQSPYRPSYGVVYQTDPYAGFQQPAQQQVANPPMGFDYNNQPPATPSTYPGYPSETSPVSPTYQPYPPPTGGGVYY